MAYDFSKPKTISILTGALTRMIRKTVVIFDKFLLNLIVSVLDILLVVSIIIVVIIRKCLFKLGEVGDSVDGVVLNGGRWMPSEL